MGGKAKWARASALVALDRRRDGWIECTVLTHRIKVFNVGNLSDNISEMACIDGILGGADVGDTAAQWKLMGNGGASKEQSSATWPTVLIIILVC